MAYLRHDDKILDKVGLYGEWGANICIHMHKLNLICKCQLRCGLWDHYCSIRKWKEMIIERPVRDFSYRAVANVFDICYVSEQNPMV